MFSGSLSHRLFSRVPENALEFGVGVMLSSFGVFWTGEGPRHRVAWQDLALLAALFVASGRAGTSLARKRNMEFV